ncbi:MAG: hypothetical protein P8M69_05670 [Flavobacteriaceae bacterium]|nr:hypothetical protein [Flavobacteriaceae bacterium]
MKKYRIDSFWYFINPFCLAGSIIGFLLYFEIGYLNMGMIGIGTFGLTGAIYLDLEKKDKIKALTTYPREFTKTLRWI